MLGEDDELGGAIERYVEAIGDLVQAAGALHGAALAHALRLQLGSLLRALIDEELATRQQVREFLLGLEQDALGIEEL